MQIKKLVIGIIGLYATTTYSFENPFKYVMHKLSTITQENYDTSTSSKIGIVSIENDLENAKDIIQTLLKIQSDPTIKGILIHINCYGGLFGTTQAIINEINRIKKSKPVIVMIENYCYSCAYYLATAADFIFALPSSSIGSIGVIRTLRHYKDLKFQDDSTSGTLEPTVIINGNYKNPGGYVSLNNEQKQHLQDIGRKIYLQFITDVAHARGLALEDEQVWADGKEFVGTQALTLGLIDGIGGYTDALEKMKELLDQRSIDYKGILEVIFIARL